MIRITQDNHLGQYTVPNECNKNVCVDVGANTGNFTVSQISVFNVIYFYEPYTPCFDTVTKRVENEKKVLGFNEAVYSEDNLKIPMIAHGNMDAGSNALKTDTINDDWKYVLDEVTTVSLETILSRAGGHINYFKIDCETSEYHLLINKDLTPIDYIGIELHWQMGKEKYDYLISHIQKTHTTNDNILWEYNTNKEVLFKNKNL
jgi:FkbM family methyltransferase